MNPVHGDRTGVYGRRAFVPGEAPAGDGETVLCLIRHGATDWNVRGLMQGHTDIPLNEEGKRQALLVAERLAGQRWSALWTSDLLRARQTAEPIAARTGLSPRLWDQLRERRLGQLEGMPFEEVRRLYPDYVTGEVDLPGVESRASLRRRSMAALHELVRQHPGGRVLVVTHGAFINTVLAEVTAGQAGTGKTRLGNTSVNVFVWDGGGWEVPVINDIEHLTPRRDGIAETRSELTGS